MNPTLVFDIVAVVCFGVSAVPWPQPNPYWQYLVSLGLVFFTLAHMVGGAHAG